MAAAAAAAAGGAAATHSYGEDSYADPPLKRSKKSKDKNLDQKPKDETAKLDRQRHASGRSTSSYGATGGERSSMRRRSSVIRRMSSTPSTDKPFIRTIPSVPSGKSLASHPSSHGSIRTRLTSISRSDYHYDLKPELKSGVTRNIVFAAFIIVLGSSFQFGYNLGVLNNPTDLVKAFYNETYTARDGSISQGKLTILWSLTNSLFVPGGMAGAFLGGYIADRWGRKRSILFSHIFIFTGASLSCACVAAKAPELLMLGRLLVGINSGIGNCLAPMFLTEVAPFNLRGALGTVNQLMITIGIFISSVFGLPQLLGTRTLWPFLILIEVIPAAISCLVLPFLPETPRYLLLVKQDRDAAEKALQFYRQRDDVTTDMEEMDTEHQSKDEQTAAAQKLKEGDTAGAGPDDDSQPFTLKELFTTRRLRWPLFIACMLNVIQQFSGINAIIFYSNSIFKNAKVSASKIPFAVVGTNAVNIAVTVVSVPLMDIAGRRPLLIFPMIGMVADLVLITISLNLQASYPEMAYVSVVCVIFYVICFAIGLGPIPMMIAAELFRQRPRALAMATAGVVNWICTFIVALGFESVQIGLGNYTFLLFLVLMILFVIFTYIKVPETKDKTFEEIAHQFAPGEELEVEEMLDEDVFDDIPEHDDEDEADYKHVTVNFKLREDDDEDDVTDAKRETTPMLEMTTKEEMEGKSNIPNDSHA